MSYFVVGDIHGCADQLDALLANKALYRDRQIILLGDFIDVGPDPRRVIDQLVELSDRTIRLIALEGNHEFAFTSFLETGDFASYATIGGLSTIKSYCGEVYGDVRGALERSVPSSHRRFLASLHTHFETSEYLFSHAGYSPSAPHDRTREAMVLKSHQDLFTGPPTLGKMSVCGHYFQKTRHAHISKQLICLDTGCGILNGPLTAALLPERTLVQVSTDLSVDSREF